MKKVLCLLLTLVMVISCTAAVPAYAEESANVLEFKSNGAGTCSVKAAEGAEITGKLVIPEFSPDGDKVTCVGQMAFYDMDDITSVELPSSIITIEDLAFAYCGDLESINLPDCLKELGYGVFRGDGLLIEITLPSGLETIDEFAFANTGLTSIAIPSSVTFIGENAFAYNGYEVKKITVDPDNAFYESNGNCLIESATKKLLFAGENCVIPNDIVSIGSYAFDSWKQLGKSISIPASVTNIEEYAFTWADSVESITVDSANTVYESRGNCLIEKSTKTLIVGCQNSVIPNDIVAIGKGAFYGSCLLKNIDIPEGVTSIGEEAFYCCIQLTSISIPSSVTTIGERALIGCYELAKVSIPLGVTSIGESAFGSNTTLNCSGKNLPVISYAMKYGLKYETTGPTLAGLTVKSKPDRTTYGLNSRFKLNTSGLVLEASFSDGSTSEVTSGYDIGEYDFNTAGEEEITVTYCGKTVTFAVTVDANQIDLPNVLYEYTHPEEVAGLTITFAKDIGWDESGSFILNSSWYVYNWQLEYSSDNTLSVIGNAFTLDSYEYEANSWGLKIVNIRPAEVNKLAYWYSLDWSYCSVQRADCSVLLGELIIPDYSPDGIKVNEIGDEAFSDPYAVDITSVKLPSGLEKIGYQAFAFCDNLKTISIPDTVTSIADDAFYGCDDIVLRCSSDNSYVISYAKNNGIKYETYCNHKHTTAHAAVASTCTTQGNAAYVTCDDCGEVIEGSNEKLPLVKHSITDWKVTKEATTTEAGEKTGVCSVCKAEFKTEIAKLTSAPISEEKTEYKGMEEAPKLVPAEDTVLPENVVFKAEQKTAETLTVDEKAAVQKVLDTLKTNIDDYIDVDELLGAGKATGELKAEKVDLLCVFNFDLFIPSIDTTTGENMGDEEYHFDGSVTVNMPMPAEMKTAKNPCIIHIKDDGTCENVPFTVNDDGTISMTVNGFSSFVLVDVEVAEVKSDETPAPTATAAPSDDVAKTGDSTNLYLLIALTIASLAGALVLVRRKFRTAR